MVKKKQDWRSPITSYQEFVPQDFIAACTRQLVGWKVSRNDVIGTIYHDDNNNTRYDNGERKSSNGNPIPNGITPPYIPISTPPINTNNDNRFYESYRGIVIPTPWGDIGYAQYTNQITGTIYTYGGQYFKRYDQVYNFS